MLYRILLLLFLLLIVPDVHVYFVYVRRWTAKWWLRALTLLPTTLLFLYMFYVLRHDDMRVEHQAAVGRFMFILLLITVPRFLFTIFDVVGWLMSQLLGFIRKPLATRNGPLRRVFRIVAMTVSIFSVILLCYGYFVGRNRYVVHHQTFYFPNLPKRFDGYRIAHFSDLHIGTFSDNHQADVNTLVDLINAQQCDAIMFTGDLVNYETRETDGYKRVLSQLQAPDGVFAVMGNHDYSMYIPAEQALREADIRDLQRRERSYGWTLLLNENQVLHRAGDSIAVIGSENDGRKPFPSLGNLNAATKGLKNVMKKNNQKHAPHTFSILLTHDPTHWRRNVLSDTHIDLTLSGHTHAGQFKIFGWSPVAFVYDEWSGSYTEGLHILNVSDGIGQVMFPFRFGAWPEVNVITLRKIEN